MNCGVDEAGRGPLAGPVVAAAVILAPGARIDGLDDSKKIPEKRRERLAASIAARATCWSVAWADASEIDSLNVLHASMLAMRRAVDGLAIRPRRVRVDGNRVPPLGGLEAEAIVGGDATVAEISAASILAKTFRDRAMRTWDALYPEYGFSRHKGYPTRQHLEALQRHGPCPLHRLSFAPVRELEVLT